MSPLPLLDSRGGRDINQSREASTRSGRGGCSNVLFEFEQPPRLCRQWLLRNILFLAQPPLLSRRGNGAHPNSFTPSMTAPTDSTYGCLKRPLKMPRARTLPSIAVITAARSAVAASSRGALSAYNVRV